MSVAKALTPAKKTMQLVTVGGEDQVKRANCLNLKMGQAIGPREEEEAREE
jgi:hypothetical protein